MHQITGVRLSRVRMGIEVTVMSLGWLLGGTVGVGTLLFAVLIGPSVAYVLQFARAAGRPRHASRGSMAVELVIRLVENNSNRTRIRYPTVLGIIGQWLAPTMIRLQTSALLDPAVRCANAQNPGVPQLGNEEPSRGGPETINFRLLRLGLAQGAATMSRTGVPTLDLRRCRYAAIGPGSHPVVPRQENQ